MTLRRFGSIPEARALAAWRAASDGAYRVLELRAIHARQKGLCYLCITRFLRGNRDYEPLTRSKDHVFPQSRGGQRAANVLLAHRSCNNAKGDRWPFPCEVIYLAAVYANPYDAGAARVLRAQVRTERNARRRAYFDRIEGLLT